MLGTNKHGIFYISIAAIKGTARLVLTRFVITTESTWLLIELSEWTQR